MEQSILLVMISSWQRSWGNLRILHTNHPMNNRAYNPPFVGDLWSIELKEERQSWTQRMWFWQWAEWCISVRKVHSLTQELGEKMSFPTPDSDNEAGKWLNAPIWLRRDLELILSLMEGVYSWWKLLRKTGRHWKLVFYIANNSGKFMTTLIRSWSLSKFVTLVSYNIFKNSLF